jgi:hypothetical protein
MAIRGSGHVLDTDVDLVDLFLFLAFYACTAAWVVR